MSLQTLIDKSVDKMGIGINSVVKAAAIELISRAYQEGIYIKITHGHRTMEEQAVLYGKGRSTYVYGGKQYAAPKEKKVTNAKPGSSMHNFGLAVDFVVTNENGTAAYWSIDKSWKRVGAIAKTLGFSWGGDWSSFKDYPHLEMTGGLTTAQLRAGKRPNLSVKFKSAAAVEKEEPILSEKDFALLNKSQRESIERVLQRLSNDSLGNQALSKDHVKSFKDGKLTLEQLVANAFVAIDRSLFKGPVDVVDLKERLEKVEQKLEGLQ